MRNKKKTAVLSAKFCISCHVAIDDQDRQVPALTLLAPSRKLSDLSRPFESKRRIFAYFIGIERELINSLV